MTSILVKFFLKSMLLLLWLLLPCGPLRNLELQLVIIHRTVLGGREGRRLKFSQKSQTEMCSDVAQMCEPLDTIKSEM